MKIDLKFLRGQRVYHVVNNAESGSGYVIRSGIVEGIIIDVSGCSYMVSGLKIPESGLFATVEGVNAYAEKKVKERQEVSEVKIVEPVISESVKAWIDGRYKRLWRWKII